MMRLAPVFVCLAYIQASAVRPHLRAGSGTWAPEAEEGPAVPLLPAALSVFSAGGHQAHGRARTFRSAADVTEIRPSAGLGPDVIEFGIYVKSFFDIDLRQGTFTNDVVLTLRWRDARNTGLLPAGHDSLTLSTEHAHKVMWLPDIYVSNRNPRGLEVISSAIQLERSGNVTKVERFIVVIKSKFDVDAFPFDRQELVVQVASATFMADELVLVPSEDQTWTGVKDGVFNDTGFSLMSFEAHSRETGDSILRKSRGELRMRVARNTLPYIQNLLVPELLILGISWAVFWLPLLGPFVMPRVATALIAFLSLMTISLRTTKMLPLRGGLAWIDVFEEDALALMFFTVCFNIFVLAVYHSFKMEETAESIDTEMRALFPCISGVVFSIVFYCSHGQDLHLMAMLTFTVLFVFYLCYITLCLYRVRARFMKSSAITTFGAGVVSSRGGSS